MKRMLLTVLAIGGFIISGCDRSTEPELQQSNFQVKINNVQKSGTGSAFLQGDTLLHIRGAFTETGYIRQVTIGVNTVKNGMYQITKSNGSLHDIIGGDVMTNHHSTFGLDNDSIIYEIDLSNKHLTGSFNAVFIDSLSHDTLKLTNGVFDIYY